jgi:3-methyladenine DNA glycosylase AlkC
MSNLLKDLYSKEFFQNFSVILNEVIPNFDKKKFIQQIFVENWQEKELKQRMRHTTLVLHSILANDYKKAAQQIEQMIKIIQIKEANQNTLPYLFFPDYIECHGIDDFETSTKSMEFITQFISCEFAVRPFIKKYQQKMIDKMCHWSLHKNHHVRRLASEGSRPRLPWAMALPEYKKDPKPILPILENLKTDQSEYVRRSVANSLNDMAKDHPQIVISIAKKWKGISKETDGIIKHGARTLLKQGNKEILSYYGLLDNQAIEINGFALDSHKITTGGTLHFSFSVANQSNDSLAIRLEYAIYYLRQNKTHSKKVFKITEKRITPNETIKIKQKQSFRPITTRKFYLGKQKIAIILNGIEREITEFDLLA